jgi:hypothetical protein
VVGSRFSRVDGTRTDAEAAPEVRDLDASAVLDAVVERRQAADKVEARLLALAVHWVDLHPVTDEHPAATFPTSRPAVSRRRWVRGSSTGPRSRGTARPGSPSMRWRSWPRR